jgi:cyclase
MKFCRILWSILALLISGAAQTASQPTFNFDTIKVAEGIYSFIVPETHADIVQGNSTAIIGSGGVLVIDTGQFPSLTRRHIAEIRKLTDQPVKFILFTHWHGDHNFCGSIYQQEFPGVTLISTDFTRQLMATEGPAYLKAAAENWPIMLERLPKALETGKRSDGTVLSNIQKNVYAVDLEVLKVAVPEFKNVRNTLADLTFDRDLTIYLGNREVQIKWLGRANTAGDAITWVPDAKVLITGDTVVYPTPYGFGSYFTEWPPVLQEMIDMHAAAIVPGHGPVMKDYSYFKTLIALFDALTAQVKAAVAKGLSEEETRKQVDLDRFAKQLAGEDPYRRRAFFDFFVQPAVGRAYEEITGKVKPESLGE